MTTALQPGAAERSAAQSLYERYHASLYRYARSQLRSPQDAEDAVQNTFLRAFAALQRGVEPRNEAAWLFKIAHNVCLSSKLAWLRRRRVETPRDLDALAVPPSAPEGRRDELVGLDDALAALPPRLREALLLREWQGLSYAEIAERLDTSRSAVETLIFRARRALARELETPARRLRQALGIGPLLGSLRSLLAGAPAALKAAGAVALLAGAAVATEPLYAPAAPQRPATPPAASARTPASPAAARTAPRRQARPARRAAPTARPHGVAGPPAAPTASAPPAAPSPSGGPAAGSAPAAPAPAAPVPAPTVSVSAPSTDVPTLPGVPSLPGAPALPPAPALPSAPPLQSTPTVPVQTPPLP